MNADTKNCPKCSESWIGGEIHPDDREFFGGKTHFSNLMEIETEGYDGISEYMCPFCKTRWNRWTGKEIIQK